MCVLDLIPFRGSHTGVSLAKAISDRLTDVGDEVLLYTGVRTLCLYYLYFTLLLLFETRLTSIMTRR